MRTLFLIGCTTLMLAGMADASTITESCGNPVTLAGTEQTDFVLTGSAGSAAFTCAGFDVGAGNTISSIELFYSASYSSGVILDNPDTVVWTFNTDLGTWSGRNTETLTGGVSASASNPTETSGVLDSPFGSAVVGPGQIDTTDLGVGTNMFTGVGVGAPVFVTGAVGSSTGDLFAQITYSSPGSGSAPEPATGGAMAGALLGLGLLARKRKYSTVR